MNPIIVGRQKDTTAWIAQVWISFLVSTVCTGFGILNLSTDVWQKAFIGIGVLYSVTSSFTLAKTIRDREEAKSLTARVDEARVEKLLSEGHPLR